jgi:hypothetical protein
VASELAAKGRRKGAARARALKLLLGRGVCRDTAVLYADVWAEYQEAAGNIREHGSIVQHPRTGNPIANPYLEIRDKAAARLQEFKGLNTEGLW